MIQPSARSQDCPEMIPLFSPPQMDVSGHCGVKYEVGTGSWGHYTIKKNKDLLSCEGLQKLDNVFQGVPYTAKSVCLKNILPSRLDII